MLRHPFLGLVLALSLLKVAVASSVLFELHKSPIWVPVLCAPF